MKKIKIFALILCIITILAVLVACSNKAEQNTTTSRKVTTKHEHEYVWTVVREATCQQTGSREGSCSCGDKKKEPMAALPHNFGENHTKESTCMEFGSIYHECLDCHEIEEIEQIPLVAHDYTITESGHYALYECATCQTSFVRTVETENDLIYWTCSETAFDSALSTFNENFSVEETSFDDYITVNGNKVAAMGRYKDDQYCALVLSDKKGTLGTSDFVIQFDFMLENYPQGHANSFLWLDKEGRGNTSILFINTKGYLVYTMNDWDYSIGTWKRTTDIKFELNTWYNIAVSVRVTEPVYNSVLFSHEENVRLPYDVYIDGELVISYEATKDEVSVPPADNEDQRTRELGSTTNHLYDPEHVSIRISDFGCGNGGNTCKFAFDNVRVYTGREVDTNYLKPGSYTFGTKTVVVDMPTTIDWNEMNERLKSK